MASSKKHRGKLLAEQERLGSAGFCLRPKAFGSLGFRPSKPRPASLNLQPMDDLNLMIKNGWGNLPQSKLPADWRTRSRK